MVVVVVTMVVVVVDGAIVVVTMVVQTGMTCEHMGKFFLNNSLFSHCLTASATCWHLCLAKTTYLQSLASYPQVSSSRMSSSQMPLSRSST